MKVRVGTRGSALALIQTGLVTTALEGLGLHCEVVTIRPLGDRDKQSPMRALGVGAFVKDLEVALADGRVDLAVYSAKDLHSETTAGLAFAAFLPREDPLDVLITLNQQDLRTLEAGASVGTSSPRRRAFLMAARPDLVVQGIRGNVDTRLHKLETGEVAALVLAAAGLARLGLSDRVAERLAPDVMLPAVGQGAIAVQARADAHDLRSRLSRINHAPTQRAVEAERAFVAALGGNCETAIAALGTVEGNRLMLEGAVLDADGTRIVRDRAHGSAERPTDVGQALAARLLAQGAGNLLVGAVR